MEKRIVPAYSFREEVKKLFCEYTQTLIEGDSQFEEYLQIQNYDEELEHLEQKYGMPWGRLYLVFCDEEPAGCIGLRKLDDERCEMKRLYVRPGFRGMHIGDCLVGKIIEDAREIGYRFLYLDTLPFLTSAMRLYRKYGFLEIPCYNDSPMETSVYMKLEL